MWTKQNALSGAGVAPAVKRGRGRGRPRKADKAKEEEEALATKEALAAEEVSAVVVAAPPTIDLSVCQSCIAFTQNSPELRCKSHCIIVTDPC